MNPFPASMTQMPRRYMGASSVATKSYRVWSVPEEHWKPGHKITQRSQQSLSCSCGWLKWVAR